MCMFVGWDRRGVLLRPRIVNIYTYIERDRERRREASRGVEGYRTVVAEGLQRLVPQQPHQHLCFSVVQC